MAPAQSGLTLGLAIAVCVAILACFFLYRQWVEIRGREVHLSEADFVHFRRKDRRRLLGSGLMMLVSVGMAAGVLINPYKDKASGRLFGYVWLLVASLVIVLLLLAFADWIANRDYLVRHHRALMEERKAILEEEIHRLSSGSNGQTDPSDPLGNATPS